MSDEKNTDVKKNSTSKTDDKPISVDRLHAEIMKYFSMLPVNRQLEMMKANDISVDKFITAVSAHRRQSLTDEEAAIEKMKAKQKSSAKANEKYELLRLRYHGSIKRFAEAGLTPVLIAEHLSEVERSNYPKRPRNWKFTPAMIKKFMMDNNMAVAKR